MKKLLLITALFVSTSIAVMAQSKSSAYSNGDNLFNVGIGIGTPFFGSGYSSSLPINPTISYEKGVTDAISVGAELSYASSKFTYGNFTSKFNATYIGARGSYHLNNVLNVDSRFDVYGGASLGFVIVSASNNQGFRDSASSGLGLGIFAGGKYYFAPTTAVYAELGYESLSYLNIGVSFKF